MYTIEIHTGWEGEYPIHYYIIFDENGEQVFESDWIPGFTNEKFAKRYVKWMFGVDCVVKGEEWQFT